MRHDLAAVRRYYDRHTASFVRFGQGGRSMHRAVWGPGVTTRDQAFHYVDDYIADLARRLLPAVPVPHLVDLGCGVGASLCYLAARLPIRGTGITVSPVQARMARQAVADARLADRVDCLEGDYTSLPASVAPADVAYAIESFVHGPSPARFFEQCAALVRPGGLLAVCDDVRRDAGAAGADTAIAQFTRGWRINSLLEVEELKGMAEACGFVHEHTLDLTPHLEIHRGRDRLVAAFLALVERLPLHTGRFDHVLGGRALQTCLAKGWIGYVLTVFRKP